MDKLQVWYEPHPVSPERKAELRAQGYRIVDAQFAPVDYKRAEKAEAAPDAKPTRGKREPKSESAE